jgi:hypothetical protein
VSVCGWGRIICLLANTTSVTFSSGTIGEGALDVSSLKLGSVAETVGKSALATSGLVANSGGGTAAGVSSLELAIGVATGGACKASSARVALFSDLDDGVTAHWGNGDG